MPPERPTPLCPICPECGVKPLHFNCVMGYWECWGYTADEAMKCWRFADDGALHEVPGDYCEPDPPEDS